LFVQIGYIGNDNKLQYTLCSAEAELCSHQKAELEDTALLDDALEPAFTAVNFSTSSSVKPSKSLITFCSNVILLTLCTTFSTFFSTAVPERRNFVTTTKRAFHYHPTSRESVIKVVTFFLAIELVGTVS
jgi:hypothetical protein